MPRKLSVTLKRENALHVARVRGLDTTKLVYVIVLNRPITYRYGARTRVAYIGTTERGAKRMAQSAGSRADEILSGHGVSSFDVRVITCRPRPGVRTWRKLERGLLLAFREEYGDIPRYNTQGKRIREVDEFRYFQKERLKKILRSLA